MPFEIPEDLGALSDADLQSLLSRIAEAAKPLAELSADEHTDETIAQITELSEAAAPVNAEVERRRTRQASIDAVSSLASFTADTEDDPDDGDDDVTPVDEPDADDDPGDAVVASDNTPNTPRVADVVRRRSGNRPAPTSPSTSASMVAAADVRGFVAGQTLTNFSEAATAVGRRLDSYSAPSARKGGKKNRGPVDTVSVKGVGQKGELVGPTQHQMTNYNRHGAVVFRREYPEDLRLSSSDGSKSLKTLEHASSEKRLTGGSLANAVQTEADNGGSLVAAAGWCAPSETIYDLCEQESMDGILQLPEVTADRGGFNIPVGGGIDFSTIFTDIGDTRLTEQQVIDDTVKTCIEIPCPEFEEVRLGVDYLCLTGSLLQRRGYPEVVERFSRGALVALAHRINAGKIAEIVAASGPATFLDDCIAGDDALGALLSGAEAAREDILYRGRMAFGTTMEMVLPHWVIPQLRAAAAHRRGVNLLAISDAEILSYFTIRGLVPRFVYDWQDAFTGMADGPGGATPLAALPRQVDFLMYPAGTWVAAVADVVNLDTIYDSTLLTTNQYTALFTEDGWAVMQMCPISRLYTANVDPCGCLCADSSAIIDSP